MKSPCTTKTSLLQTALTLIWENSYGSVSVDDICRRAGVNKGSFYYFFPSKSDLAVAAMEEGWILKRPLYDRIFGPDLPPLERIEAYLDSSLADQKQKKKAFGKVCGCPNITLGAELSTQDEKIRLKSAEILGRYVAYFESALRDAVAEGSLELESPRKKAEELFAYFQGLLLLAKIQNNLAPLAFAKQGLFALLHSPTPTFLKN